MVLEQDSLSSDPQSQENVPQVAETVTMSNELELLYSPMFSELLNGTSHVVSKSSAVHAADNPDKRQQHNTTHSSTTTDVADPPPLNIQSTHQTPTQVPTVTAPKNIIQAETNTKKALFNDDEFINIFSTPRRTGNDQDIHSINESQEEGEINDKKEQMGYEMNAPGKSVDSFEEGEIIGESDDGCVKDCMGKKLEMMLKKILKIVPTKFTEKMLGW
ncbi:hypothetical protein Tco_0775730 [Tanacetum coccineum]